MSTVGTGNKNKSKNTTGLMDSYLQKDQMGTSSNNKRHNNVLSPPEDEKLKAKKKIIKHLDPKKEASSIEEKPERTKGLTKPVKHMDGKKQPERSPAAIPADIAVDNYREKETPREKVGMNVTSQIELKNTTEDQPINDLKKIIGNLVEEMRSLRNTVHHDITDLQNTVTHQKEDITKLEESVNNTTYDIRNLLVEKIEKIDNNEQKIKTLIDENKILKRDNEKLKERLVKLEKL